MFKVGFSKSDLVGSILLKGNNWYPVRCTECEVKLSKASNQPTIYWRYEVLANDIMPEAESAPLWGQVSLSKKARFALAPVLAAYGMEIEENVELEIDEKAFVNQELEVRVEIQPDDKNVPRNTIVEYRPRQS